MPKINLSEPLMISSDLFSRLVSRGLLDTQGRVADDFCLYLQECLARDNQNMPVAQITKSAQVDQTIPARPHSSNKTSDTSNKESINKSIDVNALSNEVRKLYGGSK